MISLWVCLGAREASAQTTTGEEKVQGINKNQAKQEKGQQGVTDSVLEKSPEPNDETATTPGSGEETVEVKRSDDEPSNTDSQQVQPDAARHGITSTITPTAEELNRLEESLARIETAVGIPVEGESNLLSWLLFLFALVLVAVCVGALFLVYLRKRTSLGLTPVHSGDSVNLSVRKLEHQMDNMSVKLDRIRRYLAHVSQYLEEQRDRLDSLEQSVKHGFTTAEFSRGHPGSAMRSHNSDSTHEGSHQTESTLRHEHVVETENRHDADTTPARLRPQDVASVRNRLCEDFNRLLTRNGNPRQFVEEWGPRPVVLSNFEDRLREPGYAPKLVMPRDPIGTAKEHFWLISTNTDREGWLLPAHRLFTRRSALEGEAAAPLFESIFRRSPSGLFSVEAPAQAKVEQSNVFVTEMGTLATP